MILTLDATDRDRQTLDIDGRLLSWPATEDRAGSRLIAELHKLQLSSADKLRVVVGPGHFTGIRIAALVANTVARLTGVRLFARTAHETAWQPVVMIEPHYASDPIITVSKKGDDKLVKLEQRLRLRPREPLWRRILEIVAGSLLVVLGVVLIPTPFFTGTPFIISGMLLVSPWHGRRLAWFAVHMYRWVQQQWHHVRHGRRHKNNSKRHKIWPFS